VRAQILTALITCVLPALHKASNTLKASLWMILSGLRVALFQGRPVKRRCHTDDHAAWRLSPGFKEFFVQFFSRTAVRATGNDVHAI
jgi:hypothetical protein